jgi:hypothetical protein
MEKLITKINFSHPLFKAVLKTELLISNIRKQTVPSQYQIHRQLYITTIKTFLTALPNALTVYVFQHNK